MSKMNKLFSMISAFFAAENFGKVTLEDGTILTYEGDEIVPNQTILQIGLRDEETGETKMVNAPAGEHTLNDGTKVVVEEGTGKVLEVIAPSEQKEEAKTEETKTEETKVEEKQSKQEEDEVEVEKFAALFTENFTALKKENKALKSEIKAMKENFEKQLNEIKTNHEKFVNHLADQKKMQTKGLSEETQTNTEKFL